MRAPSLTTDGHLYDPLAQLQTVIAAAPPYVLNERSGRKRPHRE